ncbi:HAD hydrolase-like protein [Niallia sp. 01092]|uniref:HAD hydrolase-like protein n=1 Tax=unclassified Niallia TaxID=2837522 RepID=UPI003FD605D0
MIKYIIFDFDGTIADSKLAFLHAWNQLSEKYKYKKLKIEDYEMIRRLSIKERSKLVQFPMYKLPVFMPELLKLYRESITEIKLFDGMKELLINLEESGYQAAIISSNAEKNIREFLVNNKLNSIKEVLCSSRIFGKDKIISKFLKSHGLQPSEVIYVGDECRDIVACKKVGVKVIWVGWGYDAAEIAHVENPDYSVNKPDEIAEIIGYTPS